MVLPALGVAADAVMRAVARGSTVVVIVVLVVGIPSNVNVIVNYMHRRIVKNQAPYKQMMLSLPRVPTAKEVPRDVKPDQFLAHFVTIGWLLDGVASGRIPKPAHDHDRRRSRWPTSGCRSVRRPGRSRPTRPVRRASRRRIVFEPAAGPAHRRAGAERLACGVAARRRSASFGTYPFRDHHGRRARTSSRCGRCGSA